MDDTKSAADIAHKAMSDARAKLKSAGVNYYLVVAWDGLIAEDLNVERDNASSVVQRLDAVAAKVRRQNPEGKTTPHVG